MLNSHALDDTVISQEMPQKYIDYIATTKLKSNYASKVHEINYNTFTCMILLSDYGIKEPAISHTKRQKCVI